MLRFLPLLLLLGCATTSAACRSHCADGKDPAVEVGHFDTKAIAQTRKQFDALVRRGRKTILFRLSTNGGSVEEGMDLIQHILDARKHHHLTLQCLVDWHAYSMGFYFLQMACDERLVAYGATLMIHGVVDPATTTWADADELKGTVSNFDALNDALFEMSATRMKISKEEIKLRAAHSNWYMSPDQALAVGAVDKVVNGADYPAPLAEADVLLDVSWFGGSL